MITLNTLTTNGIKITVSAAFVPEQSSVQQSNFVFAYKITIENTSEVPVQLISRNWEITDAHLNRRNVSGLGVIGQQPVIRPDSKYTYVSGCHFETPAGKMFGHYEMMNLITSESFKVVIPEFSMYYPVLLN